MAWFAPMPEMGQKLTAGRRDTSILSTKQPGRRQNRGSCPLGNYGPLRLSRADTVRGWGSISRRPGLAAAIVFVPRGERPQARPR